MSVLVATSDGYHVFTSSGDHHTALTGHSVDALAPGPDTTWVAIVDRREVWQHSSDATWSQLASAEVDLASIHTHRGVVLVGTYDARLLRLDRGSLEPITAFDTVRGRDEWHAVGSSLNVRSITSTCDGGSLLANVHVGGIPRSTDGGESWEPTIAVDDDVHQVLGHPTDPRFVAAAASVGLCTSDDAGATWTNVTDGLAHTYARAVAFTDDAVLVSASDGPFAKRSTISRRALSGGAFTPVGNGLPDDGLVGNVDTACLATGRGRAALADRGGNVWASGEGAEEWTRLSEGIGEVRAVAMV